MFVGREKIYTPNLHELIEACGDDFRELFYDLKNIWFALRRDNNESMRDGKTPEEAVAKLWLELNNK